MKVAIIMFPSDAYEGLSVRCVPTTQHHAKLPAQVMTNLPEHQMILNGSNLSDSTLSQQTVIFSEVPGGMFCLDGHDTDICLTE